MKRIMACVLVYVLLIFFAVPGFAAEPPVTTDGGNSTIDVTGEYEKAVAAKVVSVNIVWQNMTFAYTVEADIWDPSSHKYEAVSSGDWSGEGSITVTNHSNTAIEAGLSFEAKTGSGITGVFTEDSSDANVSKLEVATAVGTNIDDAPEAVAKFKITGGTITKSEDLGAITVTISSVGEVSSEANSEADSNDIAMEVTDAVSLQAALDAGGTVKLGQDISSNTAITIEKTSVLDLNGKTLTVSAYNGLKVQFWGDLTVIDSLGNGAISNVLDVVFVVSQNGKLKIDAGTFSGEGSEIRSETNSTESISISGGRFYNNPDSAWLEDGYTAVRDGDGYYEVKPR